MGSFQKQSHSVLDSQSLREGQRGEDLNSPPHKNQLGTCRASEQDPVTSRGQIEVESTNNTPNKNRHCNCKFSNCLEMFCECFASGYYCNGCNCLNCHNNLENEASRKEAITVILESNPPAFKPIIAGSPHGLKDLQEDERQILVLGKHSKGCHCKKSGCLENYCKCFRARILCSENCKCQDCKNFEGFQERNVILHGKHRKGCRCKKGCHCKRGCLDNYYKCVRAGILCSENCGCQDCKNFEGRAVDVKIVYHMSSLSDTIQSPHVREPCSLLLSKSVEVTKKLSGAKCEADKSGKYDNDLSDDPAQRDVNEINHSPDGILDANRMDEKPLSPATRALMGDEEHEVMSEKETSARVKTSQEKEDAGTSSETYLEQEIQILSSNQIINRGSINGTNIKTNSDPIQKEPGDEDQSHRDSSLGKIKQIN